MKRNFLGSWLLLIPLLLMGTGGGKNSEPSAILPATPAGHLKAFTLAMPAFDEFRDEYDRVRKNPDDPEALERFRKARESFEPHRKLMDSRMLDLRSQIDYESDRYPLTHSDHEEILTRAMSFIRNERISYGTAITASGFFENVSWFSNVPQWEEDNWAGELLDRGSRSQDGQIGGAAASAVNNVMRKISATQFNELFLDSYFELDLDRIDEQADKTKESYLEEREIDKLKAELEKINKDFRKHSKDRTREENHETGRKITALETKLDQHKKKQKDSKKTARQIFSSRENALRFLNGLVYFFMERIRENPEQIDPSEKKQIEEFILKVRNHYQKADKELESRGLELTPFQKEEQDEFLDKLIQLEKMIQELSNEEVKDIIQSIQTQLDCTGGDPLCLLQQKNNSCVNPSLNR